MHKIPVQEASHQKLAFDPSISKPIRYSDTTRFLREPIDAFDHMARFTGSTRALPVSGKVSLERTHVDAVSASYICRDATLNGLVFAISSGIRGKSNAANPDRDIANASKFAAQLAVEKFSQVNFTGQQNDDDDNFRKAIQAITFEMKQEAISRERDFGGAQASVAIMAIIYDSETDKFNYIGINIGGCLIGTYNPDTSAVTTLLPACNPTNGIVTVTNHEPYDVAFIQGEIPANSLILAMSEGAYKYLASVQNIERMIPVKVIKNAGQVNEENSIEDKPAIYHCYTLNEDRIKRALITREDDDSVDLFAEQLLLQVCGEAERERKEVVHKMRTRANPDSIHPDDYKVGGDLSLLVTRISADAFQNAYKFYAVPQLETEADSKIDTALKLYLKYKKEENLSDFTTAEKLFNEAHLCYKQARNVSGQMACLMGLSWLNYERYLHPTEAELIEKSRRQIRPNSPVTLVDGSPAETETLRYRAQCILLTIQLIELFNAQPNYSYLDHMPIHDKLGFLEDLSNYVKKRAGEDIAHFILLQNNIPGMLKQLTFNGRPIALTELSTIRTTFDIAVLELCTTVKQQRISTLSNSL